MRMVKGSAPVADRAREGTVDVLHDLGSECAPQVATHGAARGGGSAGAPRQDLGKGRIAKYGHHGVPVSAPARLGLLLEGVHCLLPHPRRGTPRSGGGRPRVRPLRVMMTALGGDVLHHLPGVYVTLRVQDDLRLRGRRQILTAGSPPLCTHHHVHEAARGQRTAREHCE